MVSNFCFLVIKEQSRLKIGAFTYGRSRGRTRDNSFQIKKIHKVMSNRKDEFTGLSFEEMSNKIFKSIKVRAIDIPLSTKKVSAQFYSFSEFLTLAWLDYHHYEQLRTSRSPFTGKGENVSNSVQVI